MAINAARRLLADHALWLIVALAALVRFATLGQQSFWFDEQVTVGLAALDPLELLRRIPVSESNPPLFYLAQAGWERVFGSGEVAIRSLSAIFGTLVVPFVYATARELAGRRAGLIAAALAATSPMLVWYSQEARNYTLLVLLAAITLWCFVNALGGGGTRWIWKWLLASALTFCTHYFAVFLFAPQLAWLLWKRRDARFDLLACAAVFGIVGVALLPTFATELGRGDWIDDYGFAGRLYQVPAHFLVGMQVPWEALAAGAIVAVIVVAAFAALTAAAQSLRAAAPVAAVLGGGAGLLLLAVALGEDYILSRNLIGLWVPFGVVLAVVLAACRHRAAGTAAAIAICTLGTGLVVWGAATWETHRPDYRELAEELGPAAQERMIISQTNFSAPLTMYLPGTRIAEPSERSASELIVVEPREIEDYAIGTCFWFATCGGTDATPPAPFMVPAGFERTGGGSTDFFDYSVYEAPRETVVAGAPTEVYTPRVFLQTPSG